MDEDEIIDFDKELTSFDASDGFPAVVQDSNIPSVVRRVNDLRDLWTKDFTDQPSVDRYEMWREATALGVDRYVNELARMRMIFEMESSKPPRSRKFQTRGRPKKTDEALVSQIVRETLQTCFDRVDKREDFLDDLEVSYLINELTENLIRPVMRYGSVKVQEFLDNYDESEFLNIDECTKLAKVISQLEKDRQSVTDQLTKGQIEARVGFVINQLLTVLVSKLKGDQYLVEEIVKAFQEILKGEDLDIGWNKGKGV